MKLSRGWSLFLVAFGVWSWIIWPTFLKNIWADPRSFTPDANGGGATGFLMVHALLVTASLVLGTTIAVLGVRGYLANRSPRNAFRALNDLSGSEKGRGGP